MSSALRANMHNNATTTPVFFNIHSPQQILNYQIVEPLIH